MKGYWLVGLVLLAMVSAFHAPVVAREARYYAQQEVAKGWEFFKAGKLAMAKGQFEKATVIDAGFAEAYYGLAQVYAAHEKFGPAAKLLRKTIELAKPPMPEAYANLGLVLVLQGKDKEGLKMYDKALAIDPMNKAAHLNLAQYYCNQLDGRKAWEHIRFAQKMGAVIPQEQLDDMKTICPDK